MLRDSAKIFAARTHMSVPNDVIVLPGAACPKLCVDDSESEDIFSTEEFCG